MRSAADRLELGCPEPAPVLILIESTRSCPARAAMSARDDTALIRLVSVISASVSVRAGTAR